MWYLLNKATLESQTFANLFVIQFSHFFMNSAIFICCCKKTTPFVELNQTMYMHQSYVIASLFDVVSYLNYVHLIYILDQIHYVTSTSNNNTLFQLLWDPEELAVTGTQKGNFQCFHRHPTSFSASGSRFHLIGQELKEANIVMIHKFRIKLACKPHLHDLEYNSTCSNPFQNISIC